MITVRSPEYWPRPPFFALADFADVMVLGDTLQYSRQSYQNRARLRTPQGWHWISVPLRGRQHGRPISDVEIQGSRAWMRKHWRSLHYNYRASPFFDFYEPAMRPMFEGEWRTLGDLNCATVDVLAKILGITTPIERASHLPGRPSTIDGMMLACGERVLLTSEDAAGVDRAHSESIRILRLEPLIYRQNFEGFEPDMSVLDLLFNYGPETLLLIRRAVLVEEEPKSE